VIRCLKRESSGITTEGRNKSKKKMIPLRVLLRLAREELDAAEALEKTSLR